VNPLLVNAAELLRRPGNQKDVAVEVALTELDVVADHRFPVDARVAIDLHLEALNDGIVVDGTVSVPWVGQCRRCLVDVSGHSVSDVHELYQRQITDPEAFEIVGEQIDLGPVAREAVLLDTPATPLCRPDCEGLCPTCGIDRNGAVCGCAGPPVDPRWAALDVLRSESTD
jgi:uncharacterized protein